MRDKLVSSLLNASAKKFEMNPNIQNFFISNASTIISSNVDLNSIIICGCSFENDEYFIIFSKISNELSCTIYNIADFKTYIEHKSVHGEKIYSNILAIFNYCFENKNNEKLTQKIA